jgi:glycosyltransferase involved in cell wall biosynthesis
MPTSSLNPYFLDVVAPVVGIAEARLQPSLPRVLHIINGEHFSGAERVQQLLGLRLPECGFHAEFACVKRGKFVALSGLPADKVYSAAMSGRFDLSVLAKLQRRAQDRNIQLLHAHTPRTAMITSLLALRTGLPWVYHVHSPTARDSTRGFVNRVNTLIERYSIRRCNCLITVSRSLRREMLRQGVPRSKLFVAPNGVPAIEPIAIEERMRESQWKIGMVALMRPRKGVEFALEAMRELRRRGLAITLELIGGFETEAYQQQILERIKVLGLSDCVHWSGFTSDVSSAIRRLDALLLPSIFGEGMPMVVLEALAAAVPVVATRVEGTPEVIRDGVEGLLAEPGNAHSLADKLLALTSSRNTWADMSRRALERHRTSFSDLQMAKRVAFAYQQLL